MADMTVVVPTYERPAQLRRLLDSLRLDESVAFEVVVVDDGSAADTYDGVRAAHPAITWIRQDRSGPAAARNRGWRAATSDIVVFVDDDCVLTPGALGALAAALDDADAVGGRIEPLQRGALVADFMHAEHLVTHKVEDGVVRWLVTACLAVLRSALVAVDGFDEHLTHGGEDVDLCLRLREHGLRLAVCSDAVVYHDHRAGLAQLVRTYYRHGTGQRTLTARHPERRTDLGRSTRSRLSLASWVATYRGYRAEAGVGASLAFIVLRAAMMVPWLLGAWRGPTKRSR